MIIQGNANQIPLADKSVQCVVTSPPYWGLRDYGTATWVGGDEGCQHRSANQVKQTRAPYECETGQRPGVDASKCSLCGATRIDSQIGLERTPEEYVAKIVAVFSEVWRVLRDDGTCWVNLGDSYAGTHTTYEGKQNKWQHGEYPGRQEVGQPNHGVKTKDLVGIPWRCAFALQAAGWYLRSDIIWSKPNPMPESVTDRPTKAHEYIFLLTKKERYYFDQDAVREAHGTDWIGRAPTSELKSNGDRNDLGGRAITGNEAGRNIRTVWEIATQSFPEAHFATFPEEIAIRCIKAGTSEKGACKECGAPWERVTELTPEYQAVLDSGKAWRDQRGKPDEYTNRHNKDHPSQVPQKNITTGWQPTCKHDAPTVPCVTLDPFSGAGTVPLVADKLNRRGIGLELKADYCRMAHYRCYDDAPLLAAL